MSLDSFDKMTSKLFEKLDDKSSSGDIYNRMENELKYFEKDICDSKIADYIFSHGILFLIPKLSLNKEQIIGFINLLTEEQKNLLIKNLNDMNVWC
jgi:hypothetical protein